jgi:ABC-type branched-subunit amino acid transport system substrate-binding protein
MGRRTGWGLIALLVLVSTACGQKAGVGDPLAVAATTTTGPPRVTVTTESSIGTAGASPARTGVTVPPAATSGPGPVSRRAGPVTSGPATPNPLTTVSGPTDPRRAAAGEASPTTVSPPRGQPVDRTGVSDREIVVGVHAPISGAAPVPQDFQRDIELYWRWLADRGGLSGRTVRIIIKDDQFNPSHALQVCRELVEVDKVFLLVGIGADQVAACARYAQSAGVPYLSLGGNEDAVADLSLFFALSMTFPQQSPLLAQLAGRLGIKKVGIVVTATKNYDDTFRSMVSAAGHQGLQIVRTSRIGKQASQSETLAEAGALKAAGAEAVFLMASPLVFLNLATSAQSQAYTPMWMGPGMSNGLNPVTEVGCPAVNGARFLSPFPQLDVIDRFDPDLRAAARRYDNAEPSDITLVAWGLNKTVGLMLDAAGPDLHRQGFLAALRSGREFASNVFPPLRFAPGRPFGAGQAHLLEADCGQRRFRTVATFVSSF